jgi:penicillin-binding protein 1C
MRPRRALLAGLALMLLAVGVLALDRWYPPDLSRAGMLSPELRAASGEVLTLRPALDGVVRLDPGRMNDGLVRLLVAREDRRFYVHPGVDPMALVRATWQLARHGRVISGASTIAMQVARMLEPHPRTLQGKLHDAARAVQLQAHLGRAEIMRLYLTLAPMGGNIEGVRAASILYFGREPSELTLAQSALLVGLPQSPTRRRPGRYPAAAWSAAQRVLGAAGEDIAVPGGPVPRARLPSSARHLAQHFRGQVQTTLDASLQRGVEAVAAREVPWLGPDADVAVIVVRNRDRAILAYLGGTRFFEPAGMVDMVRAVRSPGSALKPVIYGLAFDRGFATPDTRLDDGPMRLGSYAPRDFDRTEHGEVTAAEALRQSLNRPAVRLLSAVGPARFAAALAHAGAPLRLPRAADPSLALALGGAGINLFGLATVYADLASGGTLGIPHVTGASEAPEGRLVSRSAARAIAAILREQPAPPGVTSDPVHPIAYKTGTSYSFRDAWACGFTPEYTVAVWVGRRDGSARPGAIGRDTAAPLLFRIFGLLPPEPDPLGHPTGHAPRAPALARMIIGTPSLRILFPPSDVDISFHSGAPIDLRAAGGAPPYTWMADGAVLPAASAGGRPVWTASEPGFVHLTVVDRNGKSASSDIRLVPE